MDGGAPSYKQSKGAWDRGVGEGKLVKGTIFEMLINEISNKISDYWAYTKNALFCQLQVTSLDPRRHTQSGSPGVSQWPMCHQLTEAGPCPVYTSVQ